MKNICSPWCYSIHLCQLSSSVFPEYFILLKWHFWLSSLLGIIFRVYVNFFPEQILCCIFSNDCCSTDIESHTFNLEMLQKKIISEKAAFLFCVLINPKTLPRGWV